MIKREIGNATLYCADCRDVFPLLEPVDAVVTDPPYGTTSCLWDEELYLSGVKLAGFNAEVLGNVG